MKYHLAAIALFIPGLLLSLPAQAGSTWRCSSALVSVGDSTHEVQSKCGTAKEVVPIGYKEVVNEYGHVNDVYVEEWTYGPRNGMYHFLRFEGNRLAKIRSSR